MTTAWKHLAGALVALGLSLGAVGAWAALRSDNESCRVQVLTSEERIRDAVAAANRAHGDKVAALIKRLGVAP